MKVKYNTKRWIILIICAAIAGIFGGAIGGVIVAIILTTIFYFQDKRKNK